ncbi:Deoxyhypusine synthase [Blastocladiella emersonii ATCC 22665]|nr:Deoxyhypusine synthase [Blastocladiella emersonii ATCC 22665]
MTSTAASNGSGAAGKVPDTVAAAVLVGSESLEGTHAVVSGPDFNQEEMTLESLLESYRNIGFQGSSMARGMELINKMRNWRLSDEPVAENEDDDLQTPEQRSQVKCKIFLGYTSNLVSSGLREVIRYLAQHKLVDVIVTTAGGVEEDFIKCLANTYMGDFHLKGRDLRARGLNRIGNLLVPNDNYCKFEDWVMPILDECLEQQRATGKPWTPSRLIDRLGEKIDDPRSIYYWCHKNGIPVYCPALTDGSLGDMIYFHSFKNDRDNGLVLDLVADIRSINDQAVFARKTGAIILGGGVVKHHICNANLMRNGADYAVFVNTGQEFDGSDAGARPDEAVSWGKIRLDGESVKIYADATIVFPLLVANTFARKDKPAAAATKAEAEEKKQAA